MVSFMAIAAAAAALIATIATTHTHSVRNSTRLDSLHLVPLPRKIYRIEETLHKFTINIIQQWADFDQVFICGWVFAVCTAVTVVCMRLCMRLWEISLNEMRINKTNKLNKSAK